jgi:L-cysteine/cystine lyase
VTPDLDAVRAQLPSLAGAAYLNTGGCGPLPLPAADAIAAWARDAAREPRGSAEGFGRVADEAAALRAAAGRVVGADAARIALTSNTTDGLNVVAWGIDWRAGDEIVMPAMEHPGMSVPLATLARRAGLTLRLVDPDGTGEGLADAVAGVIGPRTRLVALSHVAWTTGAVLDVAGVARHAREAGALVLVDGAQSAGAIPVDPAAIGADAYAFPAHKWLLGPEGLGALWISEEAMERVDLTASGFESGTDNRPGGVLTPHPGARRHEVSTLPAGLLAGWRASLEWLEGLGWEWIHRRVREVHAAARSALGRIRGVRLVTPAGPQAGLLSFRVSGRDPVLGCARMAADDVIVRWLPHTPLMRASLGFFTDASDIARLAAAARAVAIGDGCSLPSGC